MGKKTTVTKTENTTTVQEQTVQEALALLRGLQPFNKQCPAASGRTETWFPRFNEEKLFSRHGYDGNSDAIQVAYACGYSGHYTCYLCLKDKHYELPNKT